MSTKAAKVGGGTLCDWASFDTIAKLVGGGWCFVMRTVLCFMLILWIFFNFFKWIIYFCISASLQLVLLLHFAQTFLQIRIYISFGSLYNYKFDFGIYIYYIISEQQQLTPVQVGP